MACSTLLMSARKRALSACVAAAAIATIAGHACSNPGPSPEPEVATSRPTPAPTPRAGSNHSPQPGECPAAPGPGNPESPPGEDDQDVTRALLEGVLRTSEPMQAGRGPADVLALTQPSPEHQYMRAFVGEYDAPSKFWPAPGAPPIVSPGFAMRKLILGGRFLYEDYLGHIFGKPFRGLGLTGYDRGKKAYTAVWVDSISTGIMATTGPANYTTGKPLSFDGSYRDPISGRMRRTRAQLTAINADAYLFEMFFVEDDGKEFKTLEINYKRRK